MFKALTKSLTVLAVGLACVTVMAPSLVADDPVDQVESDPVREIPQWQTERERIQQMPIEERPNRPGHFYGNTVRRLYYGHIFVNRARGIAGPQGF